MSSPTRLIDRITDGANPDHRYLFWVSLQTSGLQAKNHYPLELSYVITDFTGDTIYQKGIDTSAHFYCDIEAVTGKPLNDFMATKKVNAAVRRMHTDSGLWDDLNREYLSKPGPITIGAIDELIAGELERLSNQGIDNLSLAGTSLTWTQEWMLKWFPKTSDWLAQGPNATFDPNSVKEALWLLGFEAVTTDAKVIGQRAVPFPTKRRADTVVDYHRTQWKALYAMLLNLGQEIQTVAREPVPGPYVPPVTTTPHIITTTGTSSAPGLYTTSGGYTVGGGTSSSGTYTHMSLHSEDPDEPEGTDDPDVGSLFEKYTKLSSYEARLMFDASAYEDYMIRRTDITA